MSSSRAEPAAWVGLLLLLAALAFAVWRAASLPRPPVDAAPLLVLAVGEPHWGAIAGLGAFIAAERVRQPGLRPVRIEWLRHPSREQMVNDLRRLTPRRHEFAAVYVASLTAARHVQIEWPDRPVLFDGVDDAKRRCLVQELHRPGGTATGYMHVLRDNDERMLQVLQDGFPDIDEVVVLASGTNIMMSSCNPADPTPMRLEVCSMGLREADATIARIMPTEHLVKRAQQLGLRLRFLLICQREDIPRIGAFIGPRAAVVVPWQDTLDRADDLLVPALEAVRRPAISTRPAFARAGGLMTLAAQAPSGGPRESYRLLARVLWHRGDTAELPVSTPYGLRLVMNARAARAQGLRPTLGLWQRADEILQ